MSKTVVKLHTFGHNNEPNLAELIWTLKFILNQVLFWFKCFCPLHIVGGVGRMDLVWTTQTTSCCIYDVCSHSLQQNLKQFVSVIDLVVGNFT